MSRLLKQASENIPPVIEEKSVVCGTHGVIVSVSDSLFKVSSPRSPCPFLLDTNNGTGAISNNM